MYKLPTTIKTYFDEEYTSVGLIIKTNESIDNLPIIIEDTNNGFNPIIKTTINKDILKDNEEIVEITDEINEKIAEATDEIQDITSEAKDKINNIIKELDNKISKLMLKYNDIINK